jgi:DNA helicase-2/ATP-dependent DNA helicase PcrA
VFEWRDGLNPAQLDAVTAGPGSILVIAGAGTGKTLTLASRVAYLIEQGTPAEAILLLTFSRRAAKEMLSRAERILGPGQTHKVWGGTFHAMANRLLRIYGRPLGLSPDFTVLDQGDAADLLDLIRSEASHQRRFPKKDTLLAIYSRMVNASLPLSAILETTFPWCSDDIDEIRPLFAEYTRRKRAQNLLDYDDLLLFWRALAESPTGEAASRQFEHVLVDEYQDTNPLQAHILRGMRRGVGNVMVVGDDAQAIYSFRAASVRNILDFPEQFPGARRITLEQNYRSTNPILSVSNAVIAHARERFPKELRAVRPNGARPVLLTCADETEQAAQVCQSILEYRERGTALHQQAVLFRASHHSDVLEVELTRRNIPFVKYGGLKFLEAAHIKDTLAVLKTLENPRDEVSWFRLLQLLDGIGPATARAMLASLLSARPALITPVEPSPAADPPNSADSVLASPLRRILDDPPALPPSARPDFASLQSLFSDLAAGVLGPADELARIRRFLAPIFERRYSAPAARLQDVEQLEQIAATYPTRGRFLSELTLDPPTSTSDLAGPPLLDEDFLVLSTVHSAKGGEWNVVHVIHAADGMFPSDMATGNAEEIEEERRLFYVALTRARDMLQVYFSLRFYRHPRGRDDAHHYAQVTRFLSPDVQALFDRHSVAAPEPAFAQAPTSRTTASVDAMLATLWDA